MTRYVAFLRAINVGGNTILKMADLKRMLESLGLENVQTFIQSGNVIFDSVESAGSLEAGIESQLAKALGSRVQVFVRTMKQVKAIADKSPFAAKGEETVHVVFIKEKPGKERTQALDALKSESDDFAVKGTEVYNLRRDRQKSVFSNNLIERTLETPATTRNMTVIRKIAEKYG
jgi:uncharacterized protein (DUF1697 family)